MKERLIGAVVLVALAVLIVPVFLDGPSDDTATISEPVTLPGQNDQPRRRQTIVLERDRQQPVPAAAVEPAPAPTRSTAAPPDDADSIAVAEDEPVPEPSADTDDEAAPAEPEPEVEAVAETVSENAAERAEAPDDASVVEPPAVEESQTGLWAVQLGSFSSKGNAESLAAELRREGYAAFLSRVETAGGELHRVRIGPQKDRNAAAGVARSLAAAGHQGQVVTHP